jgi:hypothetical protein
MDDDIISVPRVLLANRQLGTVDSWPIKIRDLMMVLLASRPTMLSWHGPVFMNANVHPRVWPLSFFFFFT